ncbi:MAG: nickel-dependent lactate racemase [Verrucomicrobiales bacterium]|jgi:nickel-dependent lactate racemase|nr:nickel-dependent lactate racemase [Verrucomicrobiales bacterium]
MATVHLPYGRETLTVTIPGATVLQSRLEDYAPPAGEGELIRAALARPIGAPPLRELAAGKNKVVVIISDHTRPVPSKLLLPPMLAEIRAGNPAADLTLLVATGCHRGSTSAELAEKLGPEIFAREKIVMHDCADQSGMKTIGTLPSGTPLSVNRLAAEADLLVAEGFIEPHFFAGFSGGRKSVLPGVGDRLSVMGNHCARFIAHPAARAGSLDDNPIHRDMVWAAGRAGLAFIVNVVLNHEGRVIHAVAGAHEPAHRAGADFLKKLCGIAHEPADIVITTNGGHPLDQNIYQAVKGMSTAELLVKPGGVIIMLSRCNDGHGGEEFHHTFKQTTDLRGLMEKFLATPQEATIPDQWQSQVLARVLLKARVILISAADTQVVRDLHLLPADDVETALTIAKTLLGKTAPSILVIPNGIAAIVG